MASCWQDVNMCVLLWPAPPPSWQVPPVFESEATKELLKKQQPQAPLTIHLRQEIDR